MLALDGAIGGAEKLKLVRELGVIRKNLPEVAGINKLILVKRVGEIRQLLSVSGGETAAALLIDPSKPIESIKSLTDYLRSGIGSIPEVLRGAEADTVLKVFYLLSSGKGSDIEEATKEFMGAISDVMRNSNSGNAATKEEWMVSAFEHFKSSGFAFDVDRDVVLETMKSIDDLTNKPVEDTPEIVALKKEADLERKFISQKLSSLAAINSANGYDAEEIENAAKEYEELLNRDSDVWKRIGELTKKKYSDHKEQVAQLKSSIAPIGQKVIDTLLNSSNITVEQADTWANSQKIEKSAITKLKKLGYQEADIRRDMAEFYRITGGKLRQIRMETDGSRRANATGIGHFEDNVIRPGSNFNKAVLWHEMAHHLEGDPAAKAASNGYLLKRRKSEKVYSLRSLTGNRGYQSKEVAYSDDFINHYIGKVYRDKTTEVWSMGIQYLSNPSDAAMFVAKDPEMSALVVGYLQSDLSPAMKALQLVQNGAKHAAQEKREKVKNEYDDALDKLADGVEIIDDGWFEKLDPVDQGNILGRWGGLGDLNARFIGSWGNYRVFVGKFRNVSTRRLGNGYGVVYAEMAGSLVDPDNPRRRRIPLSIGVHGDIRDLKAFMRLASINNNDVVGVRFRLFEDKSWVIESVKQLSGMQS